MPSFCCARHRRFLHATLETDRFPSNRPVLPPVTSRRQRWQNGHRRALSLGYGWKGALGLYHPDGAEANAYDQIGLYVYYLLNDFGSWIDRGSVSVSAFAWMGLEERSIPLWIGIFSIVPIIPAWGWMTATGLPGLSAISTIWMIVAFAGLAIHKGAIRETSPDGIVAGHTAPETGVRREGVAPA